MLQLFCALRVVVVTGSYICLNGHRNVYQQRSVLLHVNKKYKIIGYYRLREKILQYICICIYEKELGSVI